MPEFVGAAIVRRASWWSTRRRLTVRALAAAALFVSGGILACSESPTTPSSSAAFAASDHVGQDGSGPGLALVDVNGQGYRRIGGPAADPVWLADGQRVAFWRMDGFAIHVYLDDIASGTEHRLVPDGGTLALEKSPQASPDGQWVYVMGATSDTTDFDVWRVSVSGANAGLAERVPVVPSSGSTAIVLRIEDVARDGRLLVDYVTQSLTTGATQELLGALDPSTGAITALPVYGESARWSPDASQIAYIANGNLYIARSDGSDRRQIVPAELTRYEPGLSWSPDGKQLLARAVGGVHLIDVQRGTATPLSFAGSLYEPAWRPLA